MVAPGLRWKTTSPALETVRPHHLLHHPHHQTLLEPTELATVSSPLVHRAVLVRQADVLGVLLHCPLEEALAALTGADAVVLARSIVPTHGTQQGRGGLCLQLKLRVDPVQMILARLTCSLDCFVVALRVGEGAR